MTECTLDAALDQWRRHLGEEHVFTDRARLRAYLYSTSSHVTTPLAVLRPGSTEAVQHVVRVAAQHRLPLYPISRGKNWGYGDACAVYDGQVIVDLSRMDRIIEVDTTLAYAVIEPGVTQGQLSAYLRERDIPLIMDCTGAGPDTSLVGNILERGYGHSPYGNRLQTVSGLEVVLSDGTLLATGFGHYPEAKCTHLFPYGIGPYLDGLFTQSNFGVITRMGLWLMPIPERIVHFLCMIEADEDLAPAVNALRRLRLNGTLRSIAHVGNDLRLISSAQTYPHKRAGGHTRLPEALRRELRTEARVGAWTISGALHGSRGAVAAAQRTLRRELRRKGWRLRFITQGKLTLGRAAARAIRGTPWGPHLQATIDRAQALFDMNMGVPSNRFLAGAYWRRRGGLRAAFPEGADPAADNCGMLWVSPVLPMRGSDAAHLLAQIQPVFEHYGFDCFLTLNTVTDRALGGVLTIAYDKDDEEETARAKACHTAMLETVMNAGYPPYRVGVDAMSKLQRGPDTYWQTVRRLKTALDPDGIIAPGRYEP